MAAMFCTSCGSALDASGACSRHCDAAALPIAPYVPAQTEYGAAGPGTMGYAATGPGVGATGYGAGSPGAAGYGAGGPGAAGYGTSGFSGPGASPGAPLYAAAPLTRFSGMWNWGGFLLCPFWLMNHGALWLGIGYLVLSLIPGLNIATLGMAIYFGIKGNDWAVQHRRFGDEQQFVAVQNAWRNWGIALATIGIVLGIIGSIALGFLGLLTGVHHTRIST